MIKNNAADLITIVVKNGCSPHGEKHDESMVSGAIRKKLEVFIECHLAFYAAETFQILTALTSLDKKLVQRLMPKLLITVQEVEKKRGMQNTGAGIFQRRINDLKMRL